jgi:hypothetical protein
MDNLNPNDLSRAADEIVAAQKRGRLLPGSKLGPVTYGQDWAIVDLHYAAWVVRIRFSQPFAGGVDLGYEVRMRPLAGLGRLLGWRTLVRLSMVGGRTFPDLETVMSEIWWRVTQRPEVIAWCKDGRKNLWWPTPQN